MKTDKKLLIIRIIVGIVFIFSAISKLKSPGVFEIILIDQGFISGRLIAAYFSRIIISFELFIGIAFFQPYLLKRVIAPLTLISLSAFSIYLLYIMIFAGNTENCGCFGEVIKMSPLESLIKNIVLMGLVIYYLINADSRKEKWKIPAALFMGSFVFVFVLFPVPSLADNVFAKYTDFEPQEQVDLTQGDKLIAVMDVNCQHCQTVARALGEFERNANKIPPLYLLLHKEKEGGNSVEYFFYLANINYPYHVIGEDEFFSLIGNAPPRIYWLHNGNIKAQWDENFVKNIRQAFGVSE